MPHALASLKVAALQLSSQASPAENLGKVSNLVRAAARAGAGFVVLPENFAFMGTDGAKSAVAERLGDDRGPIQAALRELCVTERVSILAGGFPELSPDAQRPFNTSALFDERGELVCAYRKLHLFDVDLGTHGALSESRTTSAGQEIVVAPVQGFQVGLSICYDLRFPELYRALVDRGAEILTVPAAFTLYTGKDHWHVLVRARAIESQCYVIAAAQWGKHPEGRMTYGHALIADPWGTVIAECSDHEGFALATVERSFIQEVRSRIPCLSHRRLPLSVPKDPVL
ncbi:MAG TPA: carbon-nitrogen hydrolase family protein [Polyangiaceae bacterium]|nr:carbon-nitrogen hydrolase family protein [Polyangiaceae bacterium]